MHPLVQEVFKTARLAVPLIVGQVAMHLTQMADSVMVGQLGVAPLAGAAFGANFYMLFFIGGYGFAIAVSVFAAMAFGNRDRAGQRRVLAAGLNISGLCGLAIAVGLHLLLPFTAYFGQEPVVLKEAEPYIILLGWSSIPVLMMAVLKSYGEAINRPWIPLLFTVAVVPLNVFLNWLMIYGNWGLPAMGLEGAGLATVLSRALCFVAMWIGFQRVGILQNDWSLKEIALPAWETLSRLFRSGVGTGIQISFEVASFNIAAIMMGWLGAVALAAHQIAIQLVGLVFMIPLGLSLAVSIRLGQALGAGDRLTARRISLANSLLVLIFMGLLSLLMLAVRSEIPWIFLDRNDGDAGPVVALASAFLLIAVVFQIGDGLNIMLMGILRGYDDIRVPTLFTFFIHWTLCIPLSFALAFGSEVELSRVPQFLQHWAQLGLSLGGTGIWWGLTTGLWLSAIIMLARVWIVARR